MAEKDYSKAKKGESASEKKTRQKNFYTAQRKSAEKAGESDKGSQGGDSKKDFQGRASANDQLTKIYGKLGKKGEGLAKAHGERANKSFQKRHTDSTAGAFEAASMIGAGKGIGKIGSRLGAKKAVSSIGNRLGKGSASIGSRRALTTGKQKVLTSGKGLAREAESPTKMKNVTPKTVRTSKSEVEHDLSKMRKAGVKRNPARQGNIEKEGGSRYEKYTSKGIKKKKAA